MLLSCVYAQSIFKLQKCLTTHLSLCSLSNRVEAWTRDVAFSLRQEGRPMVDLIPDRTKVRVMEKDWKITDTAVDWLRTEGVNSTKPFVLYLGLNLPHPYPSPSSGENFGSSTFRTSLYWLEKVSTFYRFCSKAEVNIVSVVYWY